MERSTPKAPSPGIVAVTTACGVYCDQKHRQIDGWTGGLLRGTGYRRSVQCIFCGGAINVDRYNIWAVGASVGYNFGPAQLTVWALDEVFRKRFCRDTAALPWADNHQRLHCICAAFLPGRARGSTQVSTLPQIAKASATACPRYDLLLESGTRT
jgi:hypothetical protein